MDPLVDLSTAGEADAFLVGGKARALSTLISAGFNVPGGLCITTHTFRRFLEETRLNEKIQLEVNRKTRDQMRWEEMWDTALRIRGLFQSTPLPQVLQEDLALALGARFGDRPVVVRSSSTIEDSRQASHAGLHDSYVNIRSVHEILDHVRLVWASLWSDASLLMIDETRQDGRSDGMAVIIQDLVAGERSGVVFTADPADPAHGVIESVHGLNKGLVDGDVEPDSWILRRKDGIVISHNEPVRDRAVRLSSDNEKTFLEENQLSSAPLSDADIEVVWQTALGIEELFGEQQDVEWTFKEEKLYILQSRPITTIEKEPVRGSKTWNLKLKGSFGHLQELRTRIETIHFPRMEEEARSLAALDLASMDDLQLAKEILRRESIYSHWNDTYWDEFIPMAHGVRLFGQIYNDTVKPGDPFQFVDLLRQTPMLSTRRNAALGNLASTVRNDPELADSIMTAKVPKLPAEFEGQLADFFEEYGDLTWAGSRLKDNRMAFLKFLVNMAQSGTGGPDLVPVARDPEGLAEEFIAGYSEGPEDQARQLLDLGRASWRLRDDDNIYLGRIEGQLLSAIQEAKKRMADRQQPLPEGASPEMAASALRGMDLEHVDLDHQSLLHKDDRVNARQIVGQPAGKGLARGRAHVVSDFEDLAAFQAGDVLVCDAIDPNMTLLVPMACAIVERRGGMLIHGAIIARESGIPCVNGVPDATTFINTGDIVTVDGYLGLVIVHGADL